MLPIGTMGHDWYNNGEVSGMKILVSACLLGRSCKYNGGSNYNAAVAEFVKGKEVIEICPELVLGCPRVPMEIVNGRLVTADGRDVDSRVRSEVARILREIAGEDISCAVLKSRSPTCGVRQVYDGSFSGTLVPGMGVLAQALKEAGIRVVDCEDIG